MMTGLFFVPYVLNRINVRGFFGAMGNPHKNDLPEADWAQRAIRAHANAVENLVIFASLVLITQLAGISNETTGLGAAIYFWARLVHYTVYTLGIPVMRTLAFFAGLAGETLIAIELIKIM
jgi:uncharacterized MAPEG superfamily protein